MPAEPDSDLLPAVVAEPGSPETVAPAEPEVPPAAAGASEPPALTGTVLAPGERRDIIPVPLQRENIRETAMVFVATQWHKSRYHALRMPFYVVAHLFWAVVGAARAAGRVVAWAWLSEQADLRSDAVINGDSHQWSKLHKQAQETRRFRGFVLLASGTGTAVAAGLLAVYGDVLAWAAAAVPVVVVLARAGRPDGHLIIAPAIIPPQYEPITTGLVFEALASLNIPNITRAIKDGRGLRRIADPYRDGPGWGMQLDLPPGVTATQIIARREELASGLRRPLSATWPEGVPEEHAGRLALWVGFHDITKSKQPKYPLLKAGTADFFGRIPIGTDPRMRVVTAPVFETNYLIGGAPGQGKTNALRNVACGLALDPLVELWVHEASGKGDCAPFKQVAHRYASGLDDESIAYMAESARKLRAELQKRSKQFKRLVESGALPQGKLTRDVALRILSLRPLCAIFDECQNVFMHPEFGAQAAEDIAYVIRVGRAYGIAVELGTQRPDKESLPTAISGIMTARMCMHVPDQLSNDMILGTGSYKNGYNATLFRFGTDAGLAWFKSDGTPQIVRTFRLDLPDVVRICARARVMRERAGMLTGYAAGIEDEQAAPRDVLGDLAEVFGDDNGMHWPIAAVRLAERWPDRWAAATGEALSAQCRALGVPSVDVRMDGQVLKGCRRVAVEQAME